jgi:hypothetical protein
MMHGLTYHYTGKHANPNQQAAKTATLEELADGHWMTLPIVWCHMTTLLSAPHAVPNVTMLDSHPCRTFCSFFCSFCHSIHSRKQGNGVIRCF